MKDNKGVLTYYGRSLRDDWSKWWEYWNIFFLGNAELFGYNDDNEWVVKHYLFQK